MAHWVNENLDKRLGIVEKYYPRFCETYTNDVLNTNIYTWTMTACLCTDGKYYVLNKAMYSRMSNDEFRAHRIGPYDTLDTALFAAATLDGRTI